MWRLVLSTGFTREQKQTAAQGRWDSAGKAYDYLLLHHFQQERRLFQKNVSYGDRNNVLEISYYGVNDEGFSASASIIRC